LATVFAIIQQHKGWIELDSQPEHGTTVRIYLPRLSQTVLTRNPESANPRPPRGTEAVLLVEDEPSVRALARTVIQRHGYEVFEADGSPAALQVWQSHGERIKLLITDIVMPGNLSGKELAEKLLSQTPSLRVVLTSGYSAEVLGQDFAARKGFGFLPKPYSPTTLLHAVREHLDGEVKERAPG
jgi:CheY-like chemotaxis protein